MTTESNTSTIRRLALMFGVPLAVVGGVNAVTWAGTIKTWSSGDTLTAADLNAAFAEVNKPPNVVSVVKTNPYQPIVVNTTFADIPGMTVTITTTGNPVMLTVNTDYNPIGGTNWGAFTLTRDGTNLGTAAGISVVLGTDDQNIPVSFSFIDNNVPAGAHTYRLQVRKGDPGNPGAYSINQTSQANQLSAYELR